MLNPPSGSNALGAIGRLSPALARTLAVICAGGLLSFAARADIVLLKNGKALEGRVTEDGERVIVEMAQGRVVVARTQVKAITRKLTLQDEFAQRSSELQKKIQDEQPEAQAEADLWFALAEWAGQQQLVRVRSELLKKVLALDPEQAPAREASGYVRHDGRWVTPAERNQALGLIKLDGQWVSREALEDSARAKDLLRKKDLQERQEIADVRLKEAEAKKLEAERALLDAQRDSLGASRTPAGLVEDRAPSRIVYERTPVVYSYAYVPEVVVVPPIIYPPAPLPPPYRRPLDSDDVLLRRMRKPVDHSPAYNNGKGNPGYSFLP